MNSSVPVFFSEYGCNKVEPRVFEEVLALYGPRMAPVMSGGLVYEYTQEVDNKFGLVVLYENGTAQVLVDYDNLQVQYNKLDVKALEFGNLSAAKAIAPKCASNLIVSPSFNNKFSIPSAPLGSQTLIDQGINHPNNGELVTVTETKVSQLVYNSHSSQLRDLTIKILADDASNAPNGSDTSGSAPTTPEAPGQATPTKKSTASHIDSWSSIRLSLVAFVLLTLK